MASNVLLVRLPRTAARSGRSDTQRAWAGELAWEDSSGRVQRAPGEGLISGRSFGLVVEARLRLRPTLRREVGKPGVRGRLELGLSGLLVGGHVCLAIRVHLGVVLE